MITPLIHKLSNFVDLSDEEQRMLQDAAGEESLIIAKGRDIITEGQRPSEVHLIEEGWACRYKLLEQGHRHIMAYLIPGDLCDVHVSILDRMDHSIRALTAVRVSMIPADKITFIMENYPRLARALFWSTLVDEATLREWLVSAGSRTAGGRLAHLFCELLMRSQAAGLTRDNSFHLPLTQEELGETMGLTVVHVNRVVQRMRQEGLITLGQKRMVIHDWERMKSYANFNPNYLHYQNASKLHSAARTEAPRSIHPGEE